MHSWDVVNEAIFLKDGRFDGLRNTPWLKFLGPDYIDIAFHAAAKADPQALLVYNDYGLESESSQAEAKRTAVLKLLERLKSKGTPVHAFGTQAHFGRPGFKQTTLSTFLHNVADLGLKIMITEMDVADESMPTDVNVRDRIVAGVYEDYLSAVLDEPGVIAVLTWGLSDRYTWHSTYKPRKDGTPVRPLPLDTELRRKLAWNAIARAFDRAPMRT
jgi:endo-1,4-beta-xylanase